MPHICVSESGQHWFRQWLVAYSAPSHYLNQCWVIVNWTHRNKLQWNLNQNTKLFIHENTSENIVCHMAAILSNHSPSTFISQSVAYECAWSTTDQNPRSSITAWRPAFGWSQYQGNGYVTSLPSSHRHVAPTEEESASIPSQNPLNLKSVQLTLQYFIILQNRCSLLVVLQSLHN